MKNSRRRLGGFLIIAAMVATTVACGGDADGDRDSDSGAGSEFTYAVGGVPEGLDAWTLYEGDPSRVILVEQATTLVQYDAAPLDDAGCTQMPRVDQLRPNLATSWEYNEDKTQLIFTLRDDVQSADGNTMTASDVEWSFDRIFELSAPARQLLTTVAEFEESDPFEAVDDQTFAVNLVRPTSLDVAVFTHFLMAVLDTTVVQEHVTDDDPWAAEWLSNNLPTFGPWKLDGFSAGTEVSFDRNENFWGTDDLGDFDRLVIRKVTEPGTRMQLLQTGDVDYAERLSFDQYSSLDGTDGVQILNCVSANRDTLMLNQQFEPFADVRVRAAVSKAIDREALASSVYSGLGNPATTGLGEVYWEPGPDAKTFEYDPDGARELLLEAGVEDLSFTIMASETRPGAHARSLAIQIQAMLADVEVKAEINMVAASGDFSEAFFEGKYEAVVYLEPPALGDAYYSANLYNTTKSFQNSFKYNNAEYDALAEQILLEEPGPSRDALIGQLSDLVVDTVPQVYLVNQNILHAMNDEIVGYENTPTGQLQVYRLGKE